MSDTNRIPVNTPIGTVELRKMCGVKSKSLKQPLRKRQNWTKPQCIAYLNDGILPTDAVPVKHEVEILPPPVEPEETPDAAPDYTRISRTELERLALKKAQSEGQPVAESTEKISRWSTRVISEYLEKPPPENNHLVNTPLPVTTTTDNGSPVNPPLPRPKSKKNHKGTMPNGRSSKGAPEFKNWFCRFFPADITYPAWKYLSKTATDVANICRAKRDHAAARNHKDGNGVPVFEFTFSEASNFFKISRPTFDKAVKQLLEVGFIEYASRGGILNGRGISAQYRLSDRWKEWEPSQAKAKNREKLPALIRKQNPGKPVLPTEVNTPLPGKGKTE